MSKRGRRWVSKLKNIKQAVLIKKEATTEQLNKLKLGVISLKEIEEKKKEYEKIYLQTGDQIVKDKMEMIIKIIALLKRLEINKAKKLGQEFDSLYPNQF